VRFASAGPVRGDDRSARMRRTAPVSEILRPSGRNACKAWPTPQPASPRAISCPASLLVSFLVDTMVLNRAPRANWVTVRRLQPRLSSTPPRHYGVYILRACRDTIRRAKGRRCWLVAEPQSRCAMFLPSPGRPIAGKVRAWPATISDSLRAGLKRPGGSGLMRHSPDVGNLQYMEPSSCSAASQEKMAINPS
jgi:hypothetical protein